MPRFLDKFKTGVGYLKSLAAQFSEWLRRKGAVIWRICALALLLLLVLENVSLVARKRKALGDRQGGNAKAEPLRPGMERADKPMIQVEEANKAQRGGTQEVNKEPARNMNNLETALQKIDELAQRLAKSEEVNQQLQSDIRVVTDKLNVTQADLVAARKQTKAVSAQYNQKLTGLETSLKSDLATKASADDVKNLGGDVTGVKNDLADTKNNLQMAKSEMGTLIARNHEEIEALRHLGRRNYVEFAISARNKPQQVGDVIIELKGVNETRNSYTVVITAEDMRFEKKNRKINEPIFFYVGGTKGLIELVVNKIDKNTISGYLSTPKTG